MIDAQHRAVLARRPVAALELGMLADLEWWDGNCWAEGVHAGAAAFVIEDDAGSEASLHFDGTPWTRQTCESGDGLAPPHHPLQRPEELHGRVDFDLSNGDALDVDTDR